MIDRRSRLGGWAAKKTSGISSSEITTGAGGEGLVEAVKCPPIGGGRDPQTVFPSRPCHFHAAFRRKRRDLPELGA